MKGRFSLGESSERAFPKTPVYNEAERQIKRTLK